MIKIAIQCPEERTGKTGSFMYDPKRGFYAIGGVHTDVLSVFQSEAYKAFKRAGMIAPWK